MIKRKVKGIKELMFYQHEIDKEEFLKIKSDQLRELVDSKLHDESTLIFNAERPVVDGGMGSFEFCIEGDKKINTSINCDEDISNKVIDKNKVQLTFFERLENHNISIETHDKVKTIVLNVNIDTLGCLDTLGNKTFYDYSFTIDGEKNNISFESESYGSVDEKVLFVISSEGLIGSINQFGPFLDKDEFELQLINVKKTIPNNKNMII